ncbi:MAG: ABC transporter ATP-binding protein [Clostridia bacterium]|nr:ABC transporter ATP-binding protein [Clostridia bacterium]
MSVITVENLTKDYGRGRGIYNVSFCVEQGKTLGFLGPNGAGKSTTMRHLMGFSRPQSGTAKILDKNCHTEYDEIKKHVGYLPGEVAIPAGLNGEEFIDMMMGLRNLQDDSRVKYLLDRFQLNPNQNVKKMSIGEKRKLAIVAAFMFDPKILLLDEPTSGLDPDMQEVFIDFIKEEKERGKTILLSSHIFSEVEALCDSIAIIKDGRLVSILDAEDVRHGLRKTLKLYLCSDAEFDEFMRNESFEIVDSDRNARYISIIMEDKDTNVFLSRIVHYNLSKYEEITVSLEDYFMHFYKNTKTFGGIR